MSDPLFIEAFLDEHTPLFDEVLDEVGYPADVDTEFVVLAAQAVMDLLAGRTP